MAKSVPVLLSLCLILLLMMAGCVAPPKETPAGSSGANTGSASSEPVIETTETSVTPVGVYVTEATPYVTLLPHETATSEYNIFATPTPLPEDRSCRIYTLTQAFLYNGTAFSFNLKNPPMYINYSVIPQNITVNKAATERYGTKQDVIYQYSTYDPQSYFVITVRSRSTGEIYLEDGFGIDYTTYLNRTLKVLDADDMLIEIKGNKIKATSSFWVKPIGNFDDADNMTFDSCTYWGQTRDVTALAYVTATTTATPAQGSVIKR